MELVHFPGCQLMPDPRSPIIAGGKKVRNFGNYPFMAAIIRKNREKIFCGGMLISSKFILTAGYCVEDKNQVKKKKCHSSSAPKECYVSPNSIRIGLLTNPENDALVKKKVRHIIPHPSYHSREVTDDLALIELEHPVRCQLVPRPICLPTKNLSKIGTELIIAGYGYGDRNK
ncbi:peptidase S1 domain-containing protein, partial [Trichonephila clavata]